ncbi:MAG: PTS sugar transporter subunit IIA [Myxococcota bacterium]
MTGVVIVTHYRLAEEFLQAVQLIVGELPHFGAIGLDPSESPEAMRARIEKTIREAEQGDGVLVLVDMFGGTPSNLCLSFLEEDRIEVVTGLNLPMLVKVARLREGQPLRAVAELARDSGQRNISVASEVLAGRSPGRMPPPASPESDG